MLMLHWHIFLAFFLPNIVGYGGGPAIVPLIEAEVVGRYGWLGIQEFSDILALGNSLPSPIATKLAGQIGYQLAGVSGAAVALFATIAPSLLLMIFLLSLLYRYRESIKVKYMTAFVRPVIAVLMAVLTWKFLATSYGQSGPWHTLGLAAVSYLCLERIQLHPAIVISSAMLYGSLLLG